MFLYRALRKQVSGAVAGYPTPVMLSARLRHGIMSRFGERWYP